MIVKGERPALLGRNWLNHIKLNWANTFSVVTMRNAVDADVEQILQRYEGVFAEGPGNICEFKAKINMKPNANPVFQKARPVPYALKAVKKEWDRLENLGIISKVERSEWASPIVSVPKADLR